MFFFCSTRHSLVIFFRFKVISGLIFSRILWAISAENGTVASFQIFRWNQKDFPFTHYRKNWRSFLTARNPMEEILYSPISIHKSVTTGFIPPQKALALRLKFSTRHRRRCRRKFSPGSRAPVSHGLIYLLRIGHNLIAFRKQSSGITRKCSWLKFQNSWWNFLEFSGLRSVFLIVDIASLFW